MFTFLPRPVRRKVAAPSDVNAKASHEAADLRDFPKSLIVKTTLLVGSSEGVKGNALNLDAFRSSIEKVAPRSCQYLHTQSIDGGKVRFELELCYKRCHEMC